VSARARARRVASALASARKSAITIVIVFSSRDQPRQRSLEAAADWIRRAQIRLRSGHSQPQARQNPRLAGAARYQVKCVDRALLTDPIDAADALLEPHRVPRQLEVDDEAAASVKVEAFCGGVGGEQNPAGMA
jgi:hypothetical protein